MEIDRDIKSLRGDELVTHLKCGRRWCAKARKIEEMQDTIIEQANEIRRMTSELSFLKHRMYYDFYETRCYGSIGCTNTASMKVCLSNFEGFYICGDCMKGMQFITKVQLVGLIEEITPLVTQLVRNVLKCGNNDTTLDDYNGHFNHTDVDTLIQEYTGKCEELLGRWDKHVLEDHNPDYAKLTEIASYIDDGEYDEPDVIDLTNESDQ